MTLYGAMRLVRIYNHGTIKSTCTCINIVITYHGNTLHLMVRASKHTHTCQSNTKGAHVALFRRAWNAFIRLLYIDLLSSFQCPICGPCPDTVVCDGTMLGFRKTFVYPNTTPQNDEALTLTGTKQRVLIRSPKCQEL